MGGGVNPIEWVLPPLALTHLAVDQGAKAAGTKAPPAPGSPDEKVASAQEAADQRAQDMLTQQQQARDAEARDLAARTETPQEAMESRRRAQASADRLGGGMRRASQTLTETGATLSGSY